MLYWRARLCFELGGFDRVDSMSHEDFILAIAMSEEREKQEAEKCKSLIGG